jgi:phosphatidylserine/phosphatidylglycerophosphate/cardiolipin synthase-like enzyme
MLLLTALPLLARTTEIYFTPSLDCEREIIERIENAKEIRVAVYSINNDNIVAALERAKASGTKIRILTDKTQAAGRSSKVPYLRQQGFDIKVHTKYKLEHNKFAVYDDNAVSTGSFNWTNPATSKNSENCVFLNTKKSAATVIARFEELWELNDEEKSEAWFLRLFAKE